jgi:hypothetical protein
MEKVGSIYILLCLVEYPLDNSVFLYPFLVIRADMWSVFSNSRVRILGSQIYRN